VLSLTTFDMKSFGERISPSSTTIPFHCSFPLIGFVTASFFPTSIGVTVCALEGIDLTKLSSICFIIDFMSFT